MIKSRRISHTSSGYTQPKKTAHRTASVVPKLAQQERDTFMVLQNMLGSGHRLPREWRSPWTSWIHELRHGPALSEALLALKSCHKVRGTARIDPTSPTHLSVELKLPLETMLLFRKDAPVALETSSGFRTVGRVLSAHPKQPLLVAVAGKGVTPGIRMSMVTS